MPRQYAPKITTIEYPDFNSAKTEWKKLDIVYKRRDFGDGTKPQGWYVCRADNGRVLGWVISPKEGGRPNSTVWHAYAADGAFRGNGPDDEGNILDKVDDYLTRRGNGWAPMADTSRRDATYNLLCHLAKMQAPAVGYGRKSDWHVTVWKPRSAR